MGFHVKDKLIRKDSDAILGEVIEILQVEESTSKTLQNINSEIKNLHHASYDKKKYDPKGGKPKQSSAKASGPRGSLSSCTQKSHPTNASPVCFQCKKACSKGQ